MDLANLMQSMSINESAESKKGNLSVFAVNVNGNHTDIVLGDFTHKYMVIATQYEKIGSLLKVTVDQPETTFNITDPVYSVSVVFGADNLEQQAAARYIAEKLQIKKTLMCFLSLKNYDLDTVIPLTEAFINHQNN